RSCPQRPEFSTDWNSLLAFRSELSQSGVAAGIGGIGLGEDERMCGVFETMVSVVGNVVSQPRAKEVNNGTKVTSFRIASTARRFDKATGQWVDGDRVFATVNCWKRLADGVEGVVNKGDPVVVTGRLRTR